jgi:hypothetical protein
MHPAIAKMGTEINRIRSENERLKAMIEEAGHILLTEQHYTMAPEITARLRCILPPPNAQAE